MTKIRQVLGKTLMQRAVRYCERAPLKNIPKFARGIERGTDIPHIPRFCREAVAHFAAADDPYRELIFRVFD